MLGVARCPFLTPFIYPGLNPELQCNALCIVTKVAPIEPAMPASLPTLVC